jgi:two-component system, cell cycle sensor histidine kinase and response regulator CckA
MEQIITCLAANAGEAINPGGTVTVETAAVDLNQVSQFEHDSIDPGRYVTLAVHDTGRGLDAEMRAHLFEPFFSTPVLGRRTGLGLASVYGIVRQHGGRIIVHSIAGQGTTFRIFLPRVAGQPEWLLQAAATRPTSPASTTILLAEDEHEVCEVAHDILVAAGYTVTAVADGAAALDWAERDDRRLDLLVTDLVMPGMSGRELADQLVRLHPETKVLFVSGYAATFLSTRGHLPPGVAFLPKPFTRLSLTAKAQEVLGTSAEGPPLPAGAHSSVAKA